MGGPTCTILLSTADRCGAPARWQILTTRPSGRLHKVCTPHARRLATATFTRSIFPLDPPYPQFCLHPENCAGLNSCPRPYACSE